MMQKMFHEIGKISKNSNKRFYEHKVDLFTKQYTKHIVYHNRSDHNFDIKNVVLIKIENVLKVH